MSSCILDLRYPWLCGTVTLPSSRGPMLPFNGGVVLLGRLSTDSLGNCTITLTNMVVGSRYRIEVAGDGTTVADGVAATADVAVSVPYYAAGNVNNNLRIKVRKATSAPKYQPFESYITASAAGGTVYVSQVADPIA